MFQKVLMHMCSHTYVLWEGPQVVIHILSMCRQQLVCVWCVYIGLCDLSGYVCGCTYEWMYKCVACVYESVTVHMSICDSMQECLSVRGIIVNTCNSMCEHGCT